MHPLSRAVILLGLLLVGCDTGPSPAPAAQAAPGGERAAAAKPEVDPSILPRPYTSEQIRDEWVPGLTMVLRRTTPEGETFERWTVVQADAEGADISSGPVDGQGKATGEARVERARWTLLRDHGNFPTEHSERMDVTRETPLGSLDGWLYTVRDVAAGTVSELFFAVSLPGPPVHMRVTQGNSVLMELTQILRERPPPAGS